MFMMMIVCTSVLLLLITGHCYGWGLLSIRLVNYKNPDSALFNGECCDTVGFCIDQCENFFKFCVTSLGSVKTCNLGSTETEVLGDDDFNFPGVGGSLGTNLLNPLTYNFSSWQGVTVVVEVWDDDGGQIVGKLDDFVDKYTLTITRDADPNPKSVTQETKKLSGKRSSMTVTVTLYCGPNYLIPDCRTYCASRNDSLGHYQCNFTAGRKECYEGWYDPLTDCVKKKKVCTPRNDTLGHYNCDAVSGEIVCLDGWTGDNCTQVCPLFSCESSKVKSTTSRISKSTLALNLKTSVPTSKVTPYTKTQYVKLERSTTNQKYLSSSYFVERQSTLFRYLTSHLVAESSMSSSQGTFETQLSTSTHTQSDSVKISRLTVHVVSSYPTPAILQSLLTSNLSPSSSLPQASSSSLSLSSVFSRSSSVALFQTSAYNSLYFLTPSLTRLVSASSLVPSPISSLVPSPISSMVPSPISSLVPSPITSLVPSPISSLVPSPISSMVPSPSAGRPTNGIKIEMKPGYNWTTTKGEQVRQELINAINEFCVKDPMPCQITTNTTMNRTIFNMSHVIMKVTNGLDGKVWIRVKVKIPDNIPHMSGSGYLPSIVLKRIILENKTPLEKNLDTQIVNVKEVAWDHPTLPPIKSSSVSSSIILMVTVMPTTLQDYYSSFLPYVLVAMCLIVALVLGFAFYRRSKLREARVLPEPECPSEEELLVLPSRKSTIRPCSAPTDTTRKENFHSDLKSSYEDPVGYSRGQKYAVFRSESRLRELTNLDLKSVNNNEDSDDICHENRNIFLSSARLRELTESAVFCKDVAKQQDLL